MHRRVRSGQLPRNFADATTRSARKPTDAARSKEADMMGNSSAQIAVGEPYNEEVVRAFVVATMFWGVAAFTVGVFIAFQLAFPQLSFGLEWTTFGRLRPLHTSAAIFAFGGNAL